LDASFAKILQPLAEIPDKREKEHIFFPAVFIKPVVLLGIAGGFSYQGPVGSLVAGSAKPSLIDKGFQQIGRIAVKGVPVPTDDPSRKTEQMGCQILAADPRQDGRRMPIKLISLKSTISFTPILGKG